MKVAYNGDCLRIQAESEFEGRGLRKLHNGGDNPVVLGWSRNLEYLDIYANSRVWQAEIDKEED